MTYNLTNITDANNLFEVVKGVNDMTGELFGIFLMFAVFIALFMVFKKQESDTKRAMFASSLVTLLFSILLWGIDLVAFDKLIYCFIAVFGLLFVYKFGGD